MNAMRRILQSVPFAALAAAVLASAWSVLRAWDSLWQIGGAFAIIGQFLAVFTTIALAFILGVLLLILLITPLLAYWLVVYNTPGESIERWKDNGRQVARVTGRIAYRIADGVWKCVWWTCWYLRRFASQTGGKSVQ